MSQELSLQLAQVQLEEPRVTVGSSDVASILGLSKWTSPSETWARLKGLVPRYSDTDTAATRRGRILEEGVRRWYAEEIGADIEPGPPIGAAPIIDVAAPWRHARPDGIAEVDGQTILVEIKTTRRFGDEWLEGGDYVLGDGAVPAYYEAQVAWQMLVTGVERVDLVAMAMMDDDLRVYRLRRDEGVIEEVAQHVEAWMAAHVWCSAMNPPHGAAPSVLVRLHPTPSKEWVEPTADDRQLHADALALRASIAKDEARLEGLKGHFCARIGDAYGLRGLARWSERKGRESLDAASLKKAHPDIYARFVKVGEAGRTFTFLED